MGDDTLTGGAGGNSNGGSGGGQGGGGQRGNNLDFSVAFGHADNLFIYHAGQRLTTIRYFFVAYAIFVAAYSNVLSGENPGTPNSLLGLFVIGAIASFVVLVFWTLDIRNHRLVNVDENSQIELEGHLIKAHPALKKFNITALHRKPEGSPFQYAVIVNVMYFAFLALSLAVAVRDFCKLPSGTFSSG